MTDTGRPTGGGPAKFVKPGRAPAQPWQAAAPVPAATPAHSPQAVAAAASSTVAPAATLAVPFEPAPVIPGAGATFGPVEIIALAGIGLGWLLPGPGLLAGVVALLISRRWTAGEKALAILVPLVLVAIPFVEFMDTVFTPGLQGISSAVGWLVVLCVVVLASSPGAAIYLWVKANRRR